MRFATKNGCFMEFYVFIFFLFLYLTDEPNLSAYHV